MTAIGSPVKQHAPKSKMANIRRRKLLPREEVSAGGAPNPNRDEPVATRFPITFTQTLRHNPTRAKGMRPQASPGGTIFVSNFQFRFSNFRFRESCVADRPWSSTAPPGEFRTYISADETHKGIHPPRRHSRRALRTSLRRRLGLRRPPRRAHRLRLDPHLGSLHQHPARLRPLHDSRKQHRPDHRLRRRIARRRRDLHHSRADLPRLFGSNSPITGASFPSRCSADGSACSSWSRCAASSSSKSTATSAFPEGTACADVLVAGERGGSFAGRVFWGLGLGGVYTFLMNTVRPVAQPARTTARTGCPALPSASPSPPNISASATSSVRASPALSLPAASFPGSCMMPAIRFFGSASPTTPRIYPVHHSHSANDARPALGQPTSVPWARAPWPPPA